MSLIDSNNQNVNSLSMVTISSPERKTESGKSITELIKKQRNKVVLPLNISEIKTRNKGVSLSATLEKTQATLSTRRDANGIEINKINKKKVKVTYIDKLTSSVPLIQYIKVESYKQYNIEMYKQTLGKALSQEEPSVCCTCLIY